MPADPRKVGGRIAAARQSRSWSQGDAAYFSGMSEQYYKRLEAGTQDIAALGYGTISRLAVALGFNGADDLLGEPLYTRTEIKEWLLERFEAHPAHEGEAKRLAEQTLVDERAAGRDRSKGPRA